MTQPTVAGFLSFIRTVMGIDPLVLPDNNSAIGWSFSVATLIVNQELSIVGSATGISPVADLYSLALYNLAGDYLVNYAQDQPGRDYFSVLRATFKINSFVPGVVASASDSGTSESFVTPDFFKNLTLSDLQNLKTPWGRAYLSIAQRYGTLWGLS